VSAGFKGGDEVTVTPAEGDDYILQFQRFAVVSRVTEDGVYVTLDATLPPGQELGPLKPEQLQRGWKDKSGGWRAAP
jgi:hypothetical protein